MAQELSLQLCLQIVLTIPHSVVNTITMTYVFMFGNIDEDLHVLNIGEKLQA